MTSVQCFWVEQTNECRIELRRYRSSTEGGTCPGPDGYHNASGFLDGRYQLKRNERGRIEALNRHDFYVGWPETCGCGYVFGEDDQWQANQREFWRRPDTGEEWDQRELPAGAMFDGAWHPEKGPDGIALVVTLPGSSTDARSNYWFVDGPASSPGPDGKTVLKYGAWTRSGDPRAIPPTVSATPSILTGSYHGFLTDGVLVQC